MGKVLGVDYGLSEKQLAEVMKVVKRNTMTSQTLGVSASDVEVTNIDSHGLWLLVKGKEYFLPYEDFPWFKHAKVSDIIHVQLLHDMHLHWPSLDVDLNILSIEDPEGCPLIAE